MRSAERESSIELFRIVLMLAIVARHYVCNSPLMGMGVHEGGEHLLCARNVFFLLLGAWGKTGINCFVLITGYFMCKGQISVRKFLKLYFEVVFYGLACGVAFVLSGYVQFSWEMLTDSVFPFRGAETSFVAAYLVFFLLIPFLNILLNGLSKRLHAILCGFLLIVFSVASCFHDYRITIDYVEWFCVIYLIGAYLRLHGTTWMENQKIIGGALIASVGIAAVSVIVFEFFVPGGFYYFLLSDCNKPLAVVVAILSFLYFRNLKLAYSRTINLIASTTFGVLLIHANSLIMRQWLWTDVCNVLGVYHSKYYWIISILSVCVIFIVASLIDLIRQRFVEGPLFRRIDHV